VPPPGRATWLRNRKPGKWWNALRRSVGSNAGIDSRRLDDDPER
jgi:hypothetical protein